MYWSSRKTYAGTLESQSTLAPGLPYESTFGHKILCYFIFVSFIIAFRDLTCVGSS